MTPSPIFRVENLGPIRRGEVELRPLTLLIGKNNTGKTYMAQAIHAAHKALDEAMSLPPNPPLAADDISWILGIAESRLHDDAARDWGDLQTLDLRASMLEKARNWIHDLFRRASDELPGRLHSYFNVRSLDRIASWKRDDNFSLSVSEELNSQRLELFGTRKPVPTIQDKLIFVDEFDIRRFQATIPHRVGRRFDHPSDSFDNEIEQMFFYQINRSVMSAVWYNHLISLGFGFNCYYLPAGRSGLLRAWTDVVRMKLQLDRERFGLEGDRDIALGGVALDFLSEFQSLFSPLRSLRSQDSPEQHPLTPAIELLERMIRGSITIDAKSSDVPELVYQQHGQTIPIERASSMIADSAPLAIWIKELVSRRDLLIVDEPESHLHPEAIRLVARVLVRLANAGVKVLCATHSPVLLHQVSNCMLLSDAASVTEGLSAEDAIAHSDLGVFRFRHESTEGGVVISPVEIEPDWGIPEDEYVDVADQLINQAADLSDSKSK